MSGRTTAEIVDALRGPSWQIRQDRTDAADRLVELDHWKAEQLLVDEMWAAAWERVQPLGLPGEFISDAMADEILRLRAENRTLSADMYGGEP